MATDDTSLAPDELDRLEDALERWTADEFEPGPEDSLLPPHLRARLDGYREVLGHTRAALPIEEVGDDVLAAVLAEAHRGEARPRRAANRPSLWERLRRSMLLPGAALAGSAALLLWLVQPSAELSLEAPSTDEAPASREEARLAPQPGPAPAAPSPAESAAGAIEAEAKDKDAIAAPAEPPAPSAAIAKGDALDAKLDRPKKSTVRKEPPPADDASLPGLGDSPTVEADKEELRDTLEKADKALHRGDCKAAMDSYRSAMDMAGAPSEEAQSRAGYGLCLQQQGDERADKYLSKARELWPGIDGWISRVSIEGKKPSKPKAKKAVAEPFK